jgi:hypothetical protein
MSIEKEGLEKEVVKSGIAAAIDEVTDIAKRLAPVLVDAVDLTKRAAAAIRGKFGS